MIQRIQSVYLFLTTILSVLFLNGSYLSFINKSGEEIRIGFMNIVRTIQGKAPEIIGKILPLTIIAILVAVLSLITIFLYKNRKLQLLISGILTGLIFVFLLFSFYYSYSLMSEYDATLVPGVKMALPFLQLIFSVLAYRGIKKDDQLVKSYDRLR